MSDFHFESLYSKMLLWRTSVCVCEGGRYENLNTTNRLIGEIMLLSGRLSWLFPIFLSFPGWNCVYWKNKDDRNCVSDLMTHGGWLIYRLIVSLLSDQFPTLIIGLMVKISDVWPFSWFTLPWQIWLYQLQRTVAYKLRFNDWLLD